MRSGRLLPSVILGVLSLPLLPLAAEDTTANLLRAPHVRKAIYISPGGDGVFYTLDQKGPGVSFLENQNFAVDGEVVLVFPSFNPLRYRVQADAVDSDDPNFKQLADFFAKVPELKKSIDALAETKKQPPKGPEAGVPAVPDPCGYLKMREKLKNASKLILDPDPKELASPDTIAKWVDEASGRQGVVTVSREILTASATAAAQIAKARVALKELEAEIRAELDNSAVLPACTSFQASSLSALAALANEADSFFVQRENLRTSLATLGAHLSEFATKEWVDDKDYVFLRKRPTNEKLATVTVEVKTVEVSRGEDLTVAENLKSNPKRKASFVLRTYQSIVPEVSVAVVYAGFTRPKYGTSPSKADASKTVVERAGSEPVDLSAAVLLNGVCNTWRNGWVYPMFQLGISVNKDAPAILAGAGLRFTSPSRLGLAGGAVIGWVKDLDRLQPGDSVTGTADIEADLKRKMKVSYYIALQYQF